MLCFARALKGEKEKYSPEANFFFSTRQDDRISHQSNEQDSTHVLLMFQMPDINVSNQLPPRSSTNTRWTRKWATLGGCGSSSAAIPKDDSVLGNQPLKNDGQHRHSTSLLRKSSTASRTNEATGAVDETSNLSMKKSCSLMNVLRSKLNSPTVLRRFRSKSRENSKPILTEPNVEQEEVRRKKSFSLPKSDENNNESTTGRRSRKRDPSPIRRFASRIAQMTRHQSSTPSSSKTKDRQSALTFPWKTRDYFPLA